MDIMDLNLLMVKIMHTDGIKVEDKTTEAPAIMENRKIRKSQSIPTIVTPVIVALKTRKNMMNMFHSM